MGVIENQSQSSPAMIDDWLADREQYSMGGKCWDQKLTGW